MADAVDEPVYKPVAMDEKQADAAEQPPPPPYFNILSQLRQVRQESKTPLQFGTKIVPILFASGRWGYYIQQAWTRALDVSWQIEFFFQQIKVLLTFIQALPLIWQGCMIAVGVLSYNECTIQEKIPIWLIVYGTTGIVLFLLRLANAIVAYLT
jgi:hypothetical protein